MYFVTDWQAFQIRHGAAHGEIALWHLASRRPWRTATSVLKHLYEEIGVQTQNQLCSGFASRVTPRLPCASLIWAKVRPSAVVALCFALEAASRQRSNIRNTTALPDTADQEPVWSELASQKKRLDTIDDAIERGENTGTSDHLSDLIS